MRPFDPPLHQHDRRRRHSTRLPEIVLPCSPPLGMISTLKRWVRRALCRHDEQT